MLIACVCIRLASVCPFVWPYDLPPPPKKRSPEKSPLEKKVTRKNHISETIGLRVMKFVKNMDVDDPNVDHEGQGHISRSPGQITWFQVSFHRLTDNLWGQWSHRSISKVTWVKVEGWPWRSSSPSQKCDFRSHLTVLLVIFKVKDHMGQGQRSHDQGQKSHGLSPG